MNTLTFIGALALIPLLWLTWIGFLRMLRGQKEFVGLFSELEKTSEELKEKSRIYAAVTAMRDNRAISAHFN